MAGKKTTLVKFKNARCSIIVDSYVQIPVVNLHCRDSREDKDEGWIWGGSERHLRPLPLAIRILGAHEQHNTRKQQ